MGAPARRQAFEASGPVDAAVKDEGSHYEPVLDLDERGYFSGYAWQSKSWEVGIAPAPPSGSVRMTLSWRGEPHYAFHFSSLSYAKEVADECERLHGSVVPVILAKYAGFARAWTFGASKTDPGKCWKRWEQTK